MSTALATVKADIEALKPEFMAQLSDKSINFEREAEFAIQILTSNDFALKIALGNKASLLAAVKNIAAIGISLNPAKRQAYLVPRKGGICLDISYMGLMDLATKTGSVKWAQCIAVYSADTFKITDVDKKPLHEYDPFKKEERGHVVGVYCIVKTPDGDYLTHPMTLSEAYAIRDRSEGWKAYLKDNSKKCPWVTDDLEMVKKTCVKQASKYWPENERLEKALHYLNTDGGEGLEFTRNGVADVVPKVDPAPYIEALLSIGTDAEALAYYRANVKAFTGDKAGYGIFRSAAESHRAKLQAKEAEEAEKAEGAKNIQDVEFTETAEVLA